MSSRGLAATWMAVFTVIAIVLGSLSYSSSNNRLHYIQIPPFWS
jgi:hypothetical protein